MLDENEFLSPYGIRSLSKFHEANPYVFHANDQEYRVAYLPAESNTGMFGGNSNWRGPVWMPVNAILIRALQNYYLYYGDNFKIECPTGSGRMMNLFEVSKEIADRLGRIFTRDENGRRPVYGGTEKFQNDPHWRDHILFYEYFHGDNGAGLAQATKLADRPGGQDNPALACWTPRRPTKCIYCRRLRQKFGQSGGIMKAWPGHPVIYEINTWVWLKELERKHGSPVSLGSVPQEEWEAIAA